MPKHLKNKKTNWPKQEYWPKKKLSNPKALEAERDKILYAQIVKEEYERAKKAFEARKALASGGLQPADMAGD